MLARLSGVPDVHKLDSADSTAPVGPVPAQLRDVRFRYDGADHDALGPVSLTVDEGEHVAVTGANGSGKTTLMLVLSGRAPTAGSVDRPGAVGLGKAGGTAVVMQHPESQVLGTRVADDVVWGLPPGTATDVDRLLAEVGLDGLAERDTGGLSGGELQRLAVAAALAREPSLLIADEVTSMVDQQGREGLIAVLSGLTKKHRMSLVHITHYNDEAESADRIIDLTGNGGTADNVEMVSTAPAPAATSAQTRRGGSPLLELTASATSTGGTPWASTALRDIDLVVNEGDGVLIHGLNGSGKSTLAWIMAGLLTPTTGTCLLDGEPVSDQVGAVAISFQAARLQLMRGRVDLEIASAAGLDYYDHSQIVARAGHGRPRPGDRTAAHRPAQRRADAPGGAGRSAGPQAAGADPRRAAGRAGRRQPARTAAAAVGSAPRRRADGRRHLARLLRPRGTVPAHPAPSRRRRDAGAHHGGRRRMTAPQRQPRPVVLLRPVPGRTVIHELWAGTKLLVVAIIGVLLTFYPGLGADRAGRRCSCW